VREAAKEFQDTLENISAKVSHTLIPDRCEANVAHIRLSRPDHIRQSRPDHIRQSRPDIRQSRPDSAEMCSRTYPPRCPSHLHILTPLSYPLHSCTRHPNPYILHLTPCTPRSAPYTSTPYELRPTPSILPSSPQRAIKSRFSASSVCTGARRNPATCGTNLKSRTRRFGSEWKGYTEVQDEVESFSAKV
jgi:hypothetical protein